MTQPIHARKLQEIGSITHGFFTRTGGVSEGLYSGLNCGVGSKDKPESVQENRARVQETLGAEQLVSLYQTHSPDAVIVTQNWAGTPPQADALVTNQTGIALGILTADCVPVLFCDPTLRVIGAAHAGWKGAIAGVTDNTILAMETLGAKRENITCAIGPCIGYDSYEVSEDFLTPFLTLDAHNTRFFKQNKQKSWYFDIRGFVQTKLARAGINLLEVLPHDTYKDTSLFYSYRRTCHKQEPDYGRQISAIMLKD